MDVSKKWMLNTLIKMSNKGPGIQALINDCNIITVTKEAKQKSLEKFREHWDKEIDKCVNDIEYYYKTYVAQHDLRDIDEHLIKTYWENKLKK